MTETEYLNLTKDDPLDPYSVERVNENTDKIDDFARRVEGEIADNEKSVESALETHLYTMGMTTKNVLKNRATTKTTNGITYTINEDGSVSASGTSTAAAYLTVNSAVSIPISQRYVLSGCPIGGGSSKYQLYLSGDVTAYDRGSGATVYINKGSAVSAYIMIAAGQTVDFTFYPMLRSEKITDDAYQKYSPSLLDMISELEQRIEALEG